MYCGNKVLLRSLREEDLVYINKYVNDYETYSTFTDSPVTPKSEEDMKKWFLYDNPEIITFAVEDISTGKFVGTCQLRDIDRMTGRSYLSIIIGEKDSRGKGYGSDALNLLLNFAFRELNLYKVSLRVYEDNPSAVRLYEKTGFILEGTLRNEIYRGGRYSTQLQYSILRDEFLKGEGFNKDGALSSPFNNKMVSQVINGDKGIEDGCNPLVESEDSKPYDIDLDPDFSGRDRPYSLKVMTGEDFGEIREIFLNEEIYSLAEISTGIPQESPDDYIMDYSSRNVKKIVFIIKNIMGETQGFIKSDLILKDRKGNLTMFLKGRNEDGFKDKAVLLLKTVRCFFFKKMRISKISVRISEEDLKFLDALTEAGFAAEARERNHIYRNGRFKDTYIYSISDFRNRN